MDTLTDDPRVPRAARDDTLSLLRASSYQTAVAYIVDDKDLSESRDDELSHMIGQSQNYSEHSYKCDLMRDLFQKFTNCEVKSVRHERGSSKNDVFRYWDDVLANKGDNDLIIIYYHGNAGQNGEDYTWNFAGYPKKPINAYNLIKKFNDARVDCLFLLDCYIPTRFHDKWERKPGEIEIIARGQELQDVKGRIVEGDGDFTKVIVYRMLSFLKRMKKMKDDIDLELTVPEFPGPKSVLEIMRTDKELHSNPVRVGFRKTRAGDRRIVKRFKVIPEMMAESGKIEFFAFQIQGPMAIANDEGLADMD